MGGAERGAGLADELRASLGCLADAPAAPKLGRLEGARGGGTRATQAAGMGQWGSGDGSGVNAGDAGMGVGQTQGHVKRGNGADAGSGVMRGWKRGERRWCRERGWEQDECGQRGERSQVLPGLAQPSCLGRHTSTAAGLLGACQLQPLPAHIGRGAHGWVGGSAPRAPSITAGSLAPLEMGWTRASGSEPPGPGTERENAVELFLPMLPGSLALLPGNQPCLAGGLLGAGLGGERNSSLRGVCSSRPPSQRGLGGPGAPCCSRGRRCPSQLHGCERQLGGSPAPPLCSPAAPRPR